MDKISKQEVAHVARLARLRLTEEQEDLFSTQLKTAYMLERENNGWEIRLPSMV